MSRTPEKMDEAPAYPTLAQFSGGSRSRRLLAACAVLGASLQTGCHISTRTCGVFPVASLDSDGDGLLDEEEALIGTDPYDPDTDADGVSDGDEANRHKTDPLSADSR